MAKHFSLMTVPMGSMMTRYCKLIHSGGCGRYEVVILGEVCREHPSQAIKSHGFIFRKAGGFFESIPESYYFCSSIITSSLFFLDELMRLADIFDSRGTDWCKMLCCHLPVPRSALALAELSVSVDYDNLLSTRCSRGLSLAAF